MFSQKNQYVCSPEFCHSPQMLPLFFVVGVWVERVVPHVQEKLSSNLYAIVTQMLHLLSMGGCYYRYREF